MQNPVGFRAHIAGYVVTPATKALTVAPSS
jgi:hypothetical protein